MQEERTAGIFVCGCIVGLVLAYTQFAGFVAGIITGIFIQTSGPELGHGMMGVVVGAASQAARLARTIESKPSKPTTDHGEYDDNACDHRAE